MMTYETDIVNEISAVVASSTQFLVETCSAISRSRGWHKDPKTGELRTPEQNDEHFPTRIALCHSELSEALEGHRTGAMDEHLPHRISAEVELADALIRICDLAGVMGYNLGAAVAEKLEYNRKRADHKIAARNAAGGKKY